MQKETKLSKELDKHAERFETTIDGHQKEIIELTKICLEDFLNQDEEKIFEAILNKLKPGAK